MAYYECNNGKKDWKLILFSTADLSLQAISGGYVKVCKLELYTTITYINGNISINDNSKSSNIYHSGAGAGMYTNLSISIYSFEYI